MTSISALLPRPTKVRYTVVTALCLAAAIAYLSRNCLGVAVADKTILVELDVTREQMGWVMGFGFFLSYALLQVPSGWLGHHFGSRHVLPLICFVWSVLTGLMGGTVGLFSILAVYLGIGAVQAGLFPNSASTIKNWFPASRLAVVTGALGSFMSVGGALAIGLSGVLLDRLSWRWVFGLFALPGLVWAAWFHWWFRDTPEEHRSVNEAELLLIRGNASNSVYSSHREPIPWSSMVRCPTMWFICGQQFFRAAGYIFYSTWFPTYLKETRNVTTAASGYLSSLPLLAVVCAGFLGGAVIDWIMARTGSRRLSRQCVAIVCMLGCVAFIGLAYFAADTVTAVLLISAGSFCAAFAGPCAYVVTIDAAGKHVPVLFGIMNMSGNFGAALFPLTVPYFVRSMGHWDSVLFLFAAVYVAAALCWVMVNPDRAIVPSSSTGCLHLGERQDDASET